MDCKVKQDSASLDVNGPELELERDRNRDSDKSITPVAEPNNIPIVNPLSDTTTDTLELPRPKITSENDSKQVRDQRDQPAERPPVPSREERRSFRIDHPFSSVYGLGVVEDQNEFIEIDMTAKPSASPDGPLAPTTSATTTTTTDEQAVGNSDESGNHETSDGTWNSNTLTLASSSSNRKGMKQGDPKYTREQTDQIQMDWEETWERQKREKWQEKVRADLQGWRGGNGTPRSDYSPTAISTNSYYGTPVTGTIGRDLPKEVLRIERDWSGGEVCQFETSFPMELERRISPTQLRNFITALNTHLISAYSTKAAVVDNLIAIATWWTSLLFRPGHFELELRKIEQFIEVANKETFNPVGLNVLSPRGVALLFLEIEYY